MQQGKMRGWSTEEEKDLNENWMESIGEKAKKGFPVKIFVIAISALLLLGGGTFFWKMGVFSTSGEAAQTEESESPGMKSAKKDIGPMHPLDTFIVNLVGHEKTYLKAKIELELDSENTIPEINRRLPQLRDDILTTLSSKSFEDICTLEGKYQLRAELKVSLNQRLTTGKVTNIYFTEFIVQ